MPQPMPEPAGPWSEARPLAAWLADMPALTRDEQIAILGAAAELLADHYAHLPQKRDNHGIEPPLLLRSLGSALPHLASPASFHAEIALRFAECRDLHTGYTLPPAFKDQIAFLPFQVAALGGSGDLIVTHVLPEALSAQADAAFGPGVVILSWSGVPIAREVERLALRSAGANPAAAWARARRALTRRPLQKSAPPDELWVEVGYRTPDGSDRAARFEWRVGVLPDAPVGHGTMAGRHDLSLDPAAEALHRHHVAVFADAAPPPVADHPRVETIEVRLGGLAAWRGMLDGRAFGCLAVRSFFVQHAGAFLDEVTRLLQALPDGGLILDVRDNSGGLVPAAEQMLQLFTRTPIVAMDMQFLATQANLDMCVRQSPDSPDRLDDAPDLSPWVDGIRTALAEGRPWSDGHPMTRITPWAEGAYVYPGPVVLITSALCYSACDIFIAGFQDNGLGPILGVDPNTGAGGANVLDHGHIMALRGRPDRLPAGVGLHVAFRRALHAGPRSGARAGQPLEENGVVPDAVHALTLRDLLGCDADLFTHAVRMLDGAAPGRPSPGDR